MNLKAFAKANLILKVIGEENKYHLLQMLNVRINVFDEIAINVNKKKTDVSVSYTHLTLPTTSRV